MTEASSGSLTVLVVDDDFHVARLHSQYVDALAGFSVLPAVGTVAAARAAVATSRPDLVLVDVFLPDGSGLDLVRELDVDAFVLSAASDAATVRSAIRRGALAYLIKPFAPRLLSDRLAAYTRYRHLLEGRSSVDQETVERALRMIHVGESSSAPGLRSPTEKAVLAAVAEASGELSALDIASGVGISRATAQRYLAALAADGRIAVTLRYGVTGRPEHRYSAR